MQAKYHSQLKISISTSYLGSFPDNDMDTQPAGFTSSTALISYGNMKERTQNEIRSQSYDNKPQVLAAHSEKY